ncbi:ABC transporter substrate-binding protein [Halosolutus halophilus]|uniref:ABC transporter substrate-binding protein n=1 Tax=Halosolutus halophilus TaxID=1552990 RepID=UPI002235196B|nr:ABC transporter substrate-binding protein [Halosolutus halophilus]
MVRDHTQTERTVNRRKLLQGVGGAGAIALAGCLGGESNDNDNGDKERALQLLEEGFEEEGFEPPYEADLVTNENPERVKWSQIVQQVLEDTEYFDLELQQYEWTTYQEVVLSEESAEENHLAALGWSAGYDPDAYVNFLLHSDFHTPACCNTNHYANDKLDSLIEEGKTETDPEARVEVYKELQKVVAKQSPLSFVRFGEELIAHRKEALGNWTVSPFDSTRFSTIYNVAAETAITFDDPDGDGELKASVGADAANFDPVQQNDTTSSQVTGLIFEGLVDVDYSGQPQPLLAESWEQQDDTTYTFSLREGVQFHNGEELTAEHVKASMERYKGTPREADVYDWLGEDGEIRVVDDYELEIELAEPYAPFLLNVGNALIVPFEAIEEEYGGEGAVDLQEEAIGTGPYMHEEYQPDELYRISRNDDYWGQELMDSAPEPDTIQFRIIVESSVRQSALEAGDVHVVSPPPASFQELDDNDEIVAKSTTTGGFDMLIPPVQHKPFTNAKVRRAVSLLIPRQQIIDTVYNGIGVPAYGPISPVAERFALDNEELLKILEE